MGCEQTVRRTGILDYLCIGNGMGFFTAVIADRDDLVIAAMNDQGWHFNGGKVCVKISVGDRM